MTIKRLRLVAGPNGAGKSKFTTEVLIKHVNLGTYINPDEIAKTLTSDEFSNARQAQQIAKQQRERLLSNGQSLTYESVMSHPSHLDFLERANEEDYRTYLYFIGVESPEISKNRVKERVKEGGHTVPEEKIAPRYERVMMQLYEACLLVNRAYIFDNTENYSLVAEVHKGQLIIHSEKPAAQLSWFQKHFVEKDHQSNTDGPNTLATSVSTDG